MDEVSANDRVAGVILAGGAARRMGGGDKALRPLGARSLLARVIERLRPQVARLAINANGDPSRFAQFGLDVVADAGTELAGPLAGILAGLDWAVAHGPEVRWVVTVPADTPFLPLDLVARLSAALPGDRTIAVTCSRGETHPVAALFAVSLREELRTRLSTTRDRSVRSWLLESHAVPVDFPDVAGDVDPFFNVNTPGDLVKAEALLVRMGVPT